MKKARDDKKIQTMPKGVYEGGSIHDELLKNHHSSLSDMAADSQGNGYPEEKKHTLKK